VLRLVSFEDPEPGFAVGKVAREDDKYSLFLAMGQEKKITPSIHTSALQKRQDYFSVRFAHINSL
jgi:hypothetical protein